MPLYLDAIKEADDFYLMYRRGADLVKLRADIDVPPEVIQHWQETRREDNNSARAIREVVPFRRKVLQRFELLVMGKVKVRKR